MHYLVNPDEEANCLFLTCEGDLSLAETTTAWGEVQESLAETGWKRVLVDVTALQTSPDTEELFDLAKLIWRGFPPGGRIALVVRWEQSRSAKLLEMLVRGVGIYLTVFVGEEQADAWIRDNSTDKHPSEFKLISRICRADSKQQVNQIN